MEADKEMLNRLLNEIQELIKENENETAPTDLTC